MHARTSSWKGSADAIERWADHIDKNVRPMVEQLPGNAGAYFFVDHADGRALTLTLWEDEQAAIASDATADQSARSPHGGGAARSRPLGAAEKRARDKALVNGDQLIGAMPVKAALAFFKMELDAIAIKPRVSSNGIEFT